jgi:hypothetical protein
MIVLLVLLAVYAIGLAFFIGVAMGDDDVWTPGLVALIAFWPVTFFAARFYDWWHRGSKQKQRFVYLDTAWWQRGEKKRRR